MQRQVKFRGRNITTGEWVYGCLVNNLWTYSEYHSLKGQAVCEIIVAGEADDWSTIDDDLIITVDPATVGQLTGLSDKNGKEIYEGDILRMEISANRDFSHKITAEIDFQGAAFWFTGGGYTDCNWHFHDAANREVIGNIYENPELLENNKPK